MRSAFLFWCLATVAQAETTCDDAAMRAAGASGVPLPIMTAITRAETNTQRLGEAGPWPWTINHAGQGEWFDTPAQALDRIDVLVGAGESIDIGCFQVNTRWHGAAFGSAADMLDPDSNALYAASYLNALFAETGDWKAAVAAYHSRDPDRGAGYAARVALIMREPDTPVAMRDGPALRPRVNRFPLLLAGIPVGNGAVFAAHGLMQPLIGP